MPRHPKIWVVMADGGHAKIATHAEGVPGYGLVAEFDSADAHHLTRDLVSDRPGRVQESAYSGHHAVEPHSDPHETRKRDFMRWLAAHLNERSAAKDFDQLILFAPPKRLHELREALDAGAAKKIKHASAEDLTKLPFAELSQHIAKLRYEHG